MKIVAMGSASKAVGFICCNPENEHISIYNELY